MKVFQTYTWPNIEDNELDQNDNIDSELELIDLTEILEEGQQCSEETTTQLPRHYRCASHTLNLILTSDIDAYFVDNNHQNKNNRSFQSLKILYRKDMDNLTSYGQSKTNLQLYLNLSIRYLMYI